MSYDGDRFLYSPEVFLNISREKKENIMQESFQL